MDMSRIDVATATPLAAGTDPVPGRSDVALGLLLMAVAVPVLLVRLVAELLVKDGVRLVRAIRACGEEVAAARRG